MRERLTQTGEATAGEDQNRRDRGEGGGGCSCSGSTWRLIVREVSSEQSLSPVQHRRQSWQREGRGVTGSGTGSPAGGPGHQK